MNRWADRRTPSDPYLTLRADDWCWKVLQAYQDGREDLASPYSRWLCHVTGPHNQPARIEDVYVNFLITQAAHRVGLEQQLVDIIRKRDEEEP